MEWLIPFVLKGRRFEDNWSQVEMVIRHEDVSYFHAF